MNTCKTFLFAMAAAALAGGCQSPQGTTPPPSAAEIAANTLIVDTHVDLPYRLYRNALDASQATDSGDFDYPRAVAGGLNAPFMSIYVPAAVDAAGDAFNFAEQAIATVEYLARMNPDKFAVATCADDVDRHFEQGVISLPMGIENGAPIAGSVEHLEHFFNRGIRYITLAHSKSNHISDSSYDENEPLQGLSDFGKTLIGEMNRLGVMIDVSHISDNAFWQVMQLSNAPVIASHSSLRHFTPGFQRNMSDDMVKALAAQGGVIQINFGSRFLHQPARDHRAARMAATRAFQAEHHLADNDPALMQFYQDYTLEHPYPYATLDTVLDHIDRAVDIAGIDAVGIGSDYDGVGDSLPQGLKDAASYPNLVQGLLDRGYSEADIAKILGGNTMRVWRAAEAYASAQGTPTQCRES
jgi:membrane dipeptidase